MGTTRNSIRSKTRYGNGLVSRTSSKVGECVLGLQVWLDGQTWAQLCLSRKVSPPSTHSAVLDRELGTKRLQRFGGTFGEEGSGYKAARWSLVTFYHPARKGRLVISYPCVMGHSTPPAFCLFFQTYLSCQLSLHASGLRSVAGVSAVKLQGSGPAGRKSLGQTGGRLARYPPGPPDLGLWSRGFGLGKWVASARPGFACRAGPLCTSGEGWQTVVEAISKT